MRDFAPNKNSSRSGYYYIADGFANKKLNLNVQSYFQLSKVFMCNRGKKKNWTESTQAVKGQNQTSSLT